MYRCKQAAGCQPAYIDLFSEPASSIRGELAPDERIVLHTRPHVGLLVSRLPRFLWVSILNGIVSYGIFICSAAFSGFFAFDPDPSVIIVVFIAWVLGFPSA